MDSAAEIGPEIEGELETIGWCLWSWSEDAETIGEEIGGGTRGAFLFGAGDGVCADEFGAREGIGFDVGDDLGFCASDIGDEGVGGRGGGGAFGAMCDGIDGGADDDEIGVLGGVFEGVCDGIEGVEGMEIGGIAAIKTDELGSVWLGA